MTGSGALQEHRKLLLMRKKRLEQLITLTEQGWKGELQMNFKPFDEKELLQYQQEAKERWGDTGAWQQSQQKAKGRSKEDWNQVKEEADAIISGDGPAGRHRPRRRSDTADGSAAGRTTSPATTTTAPARFWRGWERCTARTNGLPKISTVTPTAWRNFWRRQSKFIVKIHHKFAR